MFVNPPVVMLIRHYCYLLYVCNTEILSPDDSVSYSVCIMPNTCSKFLILHNSSSLKSHLYRSFQSCAHCLGSTKDFRPVIGITSIDEDRSRSMFGSSHDIGLFENLWFDHFAINSSSSCARSALFAFSHASFSSSVSPLMRGFFAALVSVPLTPRRSGSHMTMRSSRARVIAV
jgi:hypothetical protein